MQLYWDSIFFPVKGGNSAACGNSLHGCFKGNIKRAGNRGCVSQFKSSYVHFALDFLKFMIDLKLVCTLNAEGMIDSRAKIDGNPVRIVFNRSYSLNPLIYSSLAGILVS